MGLSIRPVVIALVLGLGCGACQQPGAALHGPSPTATVEAGIMECPEGKPVHAGLQNFGAYIGTWQANRPHDAQSPTDYVIGSIAGRVTVRCTADGFVVVEAIHPLFDSPAGQALRVALTDIPADSQKVYDHLHSGCRVLQYTSLELARQLGANDADGRVDITFTSEGAAYSSAGVKLITMDIRNGLGADTITC